MNFPSGLAVSLPQELLLSGKSGPWQVKPAEQFEPIARMSDKALFDFAESILTIMAEGPDTASPELIEYVDLLSLQCEREIMRRSF